MSKFKTKFKMYDILKDKVSGFEGVALGITFYATGCIHYGLAPTKVKDDGTVHVWEWFDETRLKYISHHEDMEKDDTIPHSGPDFNPKMK